MIAPIVHVAPHTPAKIASAVLMTAAAYSLGWSNVDPHDVPEVWAPYTVEPCKVVARRTECGWKITIVGLYEPGNGPGQKFIWNVTRGSAVMSHGHVRVYPYDRTARRTRPDTGDTGNTETTRNTKGGEWQ